MSTKLPKGEAAFNRLYWKYNWSSKKRKLEWNLTKDQFRGIVTLNCKYCGMEPSQVLTHYGHNGGFTYNGVDRINNNLGYTVENTVPCCWRCNYAKGDQTSDELIRWIQRAAQFQENNNLV